MVNIAAISPEYARIRKQVGGGLAGGRAEGEAFDPETHDPQDPNSWTRMVKPVGNYGWGGLASIGEGLHNAWALNKAEGARQEQRASQAAGSAALDKFISGGGLAGGVDAIAPLLRHPGMRQTGMSMLMESQREKRAAEQSDRQHARSLELENIRYDKALELDDRRTNRSELRDDRREKLRMEAIKAQAEETRRLEEQKYRQNSGVDFLDEMKRRGIEPNYATPDEDEDAPGGGLAAAPREPVPGRIGGGLAAPQAAPVVPKAPVIGPGMGGGMGAVRPQAPMSRLGGPMGDLSVGELEPGIPNGVRAVGDGTRPDLTQVQARPGGRRGLPQTPEEIEKERLRNDPTLLTEEERLNGVTIDEKARNIRMRYYINRDFMGKPPQVGHKYVLSKDGKSVDQVPSAPPKSKASDISPEQIGLVIDRINKAMPVLGGTVDEKGNVKGNGPWMASKILSNATSGWIKPELYQAMQTGHYAAMQALYAQSGKSFSKSEMEQDLKLFKPLPTDSDEMSYYKLQSVKDLITSLAVARGLSDEQKASLYKSELAKANMRLLDGPGAAKKPAAEPPRAMTPQAPQAGQPPARKVWDPATGTFKEVR